MESYENMLLEKLEEITSVIKTKSFEEKLKVLKDKDNDKS